MEAPSIRWLFRGLEDLNDTRMIASKAHVRVFLFLGDADIFIGNKEGASS